MKFPLKRTHRLHELRHSHCGKRVVLMGWVNRVRDLGQLVFIDLRDRWGLTQLSFTAATLVAPLEEVLAVRDEWVLAVEGEVAARPQEMVNQQLPTGAIEVQVTQWQVLSRAEALPFPIAEGADIKASDSTRLTYRYLDLRRRAVKDSILQRVKLVRAIRSALEAHDFLDIETPLLYKSTPEGAREFIVPSRIQPQHFYALPQSPQLFKQLLMVAGFDRYYQIVKCFRDEDLRADRQPEFTQVDCELSFVDQEQVLMIIEQVMQRALQELNPDYEPQPFARMTYAEAIDSYGSDKPDLRYELKLQRVSPEIFAGCGFQVLEDALRADDGAIYAIKTTNCADKFSRRDFEQLQEVVRQAGGEGLLWIKVQQTLDDARAWQSPLKKYLDAERVRGLTELLSLQLGDVVFIAGGERQRACLALGALRVHLADKLQLCDDQQQCWLWVTDFPLFARDHEGKLSAAHHPFTRPHADDVQYFGSAPEKIRACAHDLVLNGVEVGGGSLRIHESELQQQVFAALRLSATEIDRKFGFLLRALRYGTPPHGGIALGLDRLAMLLSGNSSIRDVIAFPKTHKGGCLMTGSPSTLSREILQEYHVHPLT